MADFIIVKEARARRANGTFVVLPARKVISDSEYDIEQLRLQGVPLVAYRPELMAPLADAADNQAGRSMTDTDFLALMSSGGAFSDVPTTTTQLIRVSNDGDDDNPGTEDEPVATMRGVSRLLPRRFRGESVGAVVRFDAGYVAPNPSENLQFANTSSEFGGTAIFDAPTIIFDVVRDPVLANTPSDPRYSVLKGPLTPTSVATVNARNEYTFAGGTFVVSEETTLDHCQVRVFAATGELKYMGALESVSSTTQVLRIKGTVNAAQPAPLTTDTIYVVEPTTRFADIEITGYLDATVYFFNMLVTGQVFTSCQMASRTNSLLFGGGMCFDKASATAAPLQFYPPGTPIVILGGANLLPFITFRLDPVLNYDTAELNSLAGSACNVSNLVAGGDALFSAPRSGTNPVPRDGGPAMRIDGAVMSGDVTWLGGTLDASSVTIKPVAGRTTSVRNARLAFSAGFVAEKTTLGNPVVLSNTASIEVSEALVETEDFTGTAVMSTEGGSVANEVNFTPRNAGVPALQPGGAVVYSAGPFSQIDVDTSSTVTGATAGQDVRAGTNTPISYATLVTNSTEVDAARLALLLS